MTITSLTFHRNKLCSRLRQQQLSAPVEACYIIHGYTSKMALTTIVHEGKVYQPYAAFLQYTDPIVVKLECGKLVQGVSRISRMGDFVNFVTDKGEIKHAGSWRRDNEAIWTPAKVYPISVYAVLLG